jgi:hypothetical protein
MIIYCRHKYRPIVGEADQQYRAWRQKLFHLVFRPILTTQLKTEILIKIFIYFIS